MFGAAIKFTPDADHQMRMAVVDGFDPTDGVGETHGIKSMAPPLIQAPVLPVLNDVVERNPALAEAVHHIKARLLGFVSLPALPEPECPLRDHHRLAREIPHAGDHLVNRRAIDEVIVDAASNLAPERCGLRFLSGSFPIEFENGRAGVLDPFKMNGISLARFKMNLGDIIGGKPGLSPMVEHDPITDD